MLTQLWRQIGTSKEMPHAARRYSTGSASVAPATESNLAANNKPPPPSSRRRSSILGDVQNLIQLNTPEIDDTTLEEDGAPATSRLFVALVKRLYDEDHHTATTVQSHFEAWRRENLIGIDDPRILSLFDDALPALITRLVWFEQKQRGATKRTVFCTVCLTFFDTVSDYSTYVVMAHYGSTLADPMLAVLLLSMGMQALIAQFVTKEGPLATACALFGLKPVFDGVNIVFDLPRRPNAAPSATAFIMTRVIETATESILFGIMQSFALVKHRSIVQLISFAITVVNIAHSVASVDYGIDSSHDNQMSEPLCYGAYPIGTKGDVMFLSLAMFAMGYIVSKLVAITVLGTLASLSLALVLMGECVALLAVRAAIGNWRPYPPAGDSTTFSLTTHFFITYPVMLAAPFPMARQPFFLTPRIFSGFVVWTLCAANPLMLTLAFRHNIPAGSSISPSLVWTIWSAATALSMSGALLVLMLVDPKVLGTFYRHRTLATHVREYHWVRDTKWDGTKIETNDDRDATRAETLSIYSKYYWPTDRVRVWVREGWPHWLVSAPVWFTEEWRARIPKDWFYGDDTIISMTRQETNFREASGQREPWTLGPRELTAYLNERFVNSAALPGGVEKVKRRQLVQQLTDVSGFGLLDRCCSNKTETPWVTISHAANGTPLRDELRAAQLVVFLQEAGISFYYQLYVVSAASAHSPLHGYDFVEPIQRKHSHYETMIVRNRQTQQQDMLMLTSVDNLNVTQMTREGKKLSDIQTISNQCEFVASIYQWGETPAGIVYYITEYCEGGLLATRIKPNVGLDNPELFWKVSYQLACAVTAVHQSGLDRMNIRVSVYSLRNSTLVVPSPTRMFFSAYRSRTHCSRPRTTFALLTSVCTVSPSR